MHKLKIFVAFLLILVVSGAKAQFKADTVKAGIYDNGKMWTFDYPPSDFFKKTYHFEADKQWFEYVQKAALRFATYCSASFVSANGLVMTNHHCARESGTSAQKPGENLNNTGFYAKTLADERKVEGLFVDQLTKIEDITERVQKAMDAGKTDSEQLRLRESELNAAKKEFADKEDWKNLQLEVKTFYNGGKYSIYGFKRYSDVRLVFMPELQLGFFGGDYDNFTYPRYALDCSFFRVYDDTGKPLKTDYFFKFNPNGIQENEPVFVVGNPGTTQRGFTSSDFEYLRDAYMPLILKNLKSNSLALQEYNKTAKSDSIMNEIFGIENSFKAYTGQLGSLKDDYLMARRKAFENDFKVAVRNNPKLRQNYAVWDELAMHNQVRKKYLTDNFLMATNTANDGMALATQIAMANPTGKAGQISAGASNEAIVNAPMPESMQFEELQLTVYLEMLNAFLSPDDPVRKIALNGKSPKEAAAELMKTTKIYSKEGRQELLEKGGITDPFINIASLAIPRRKEAAMKFQEVNPKIQAIRSKMGKMLFDVYGTNIPPDATFSPRINDGIVKSYEYNGTVAPYKTTFAGMYDRFYSFDGQFPWSLPDRWKNPPVELMKAPFNFITTNDIIGGNSGSPMINKNKEAVGLVFDGNMESLAGAYIYEPSKNRAVGVHAGGIVAALRYIFKADRIVKELEGK